MGWTPQPLALFTAPFRCQLRLAVVRIRAVLRSGLTLVVPVFLAAIAAITAGCGGGFEARIRSAADATTVPTDLVVVYDDSDGDCGGERIEVHGDRSIDAQRWRPGGRDEDAIQWSGTIPETSLAALVDLLVDIRVWEQRDRDEEGRLEDGRARLRVRLGGESASMWEWATDLEARGRIVRVKQHLEALAFDARHPMVDGGGMAGGGGD